eukprot:3805144-Pleurochrysis_carterae.AAC.1
MLTAFRMRGGGVLFTLGRDVVRPDAGDGGLLVQLYDAEGGEVIPVPVMERLVQQSDGALQGVLSYDKRQGVAATSLRSQNLPARLSP